MGYTHGLGAGVVEHVGSNVDGLSLDLVGPTGVVSQAANDGSDIAAGAGNRLAIVEGLNSGEEVQVLLSKIGELQHVSTSLLGSGLLPGALEGLSGSGDSKVDILLGTLADGGDGLLGGGVDDLELLLVNTLNPLAVDEAGDG